MRWFPRVFLALALVGAGHVSQAGTALAADPSAEEQFVSLINQERAAAGRAPLMASSPVRTVARTWTDVMMGQANGCSGASLVHNPIYSLQIPAGWSRAGENVGCGSSAEGVVGMVHRAFMASPGHRANILGDYNQVGVGVSFDASGTMWVTQNFMQHPVLIPLLPLLTPRDIADACPAALVPGAGFGDVALSDVHRGAIDCVVWWDVANGSTASRFNPSAPVTRDQLASFIARLIERSGGALPAAPVDAFGDDNGSVHELRINQLAAVGIVSGTGGGAYSPREVVRRDQMATFLVRAYQYRSGTALAAGGNAFADDAGNLHEASINAAAAAGFTAGSADGSYVPGGDVARNAMSSFLARVLDKLVQDAGTALPG
ncbi:MAG: CAP domain-containing protein [Acidimicrobiales bacterium]